MFFLLISPSVSKSFSLPTVVFFSPLLILIYSKKKAIKLAHSPINSSPSFDSPLEFAFSSLTMFSNSTFSPCNPPTTL